MRIHAFHNKAIFIEMPFHPEPQKFVFHLFHLFSLVFYLFSAAIGMSMVGMVNTHSFISMFCFVASVGTSFSYVRSRSLDGKLQC